MVCVMGITNDVEPPPPFIPIISFNFKDAMRQTADRTRAAGGAACVLTCSANAQHTDETRNHPRGNNNKGPYTNLSCIYKQQYHDPPRFSPPPPPAKQTLKLFPRWYRMCIGCGWGQVWVWTQVCLCGCAQEGRRSGSHVLPHIHIHIHRHPHPNPNPPRPRPHTQA